MYIVGNTENVWGNKDLLTGNAKNLYGNISGLSGDVTGLTGCCSFIGGGTKTISRITVDLNNINKLMDKLNIKKLHFSNLSIWLLTKNNKTTKLQDIPVSINSISELEELLLSRVSKKFLGIS